MTSTTPSSVRILGISGSLRRASSCTAILRTLQDKLGGKAELIIHPLNDLPLYDQDIDNETAPESVFAFKRAIAEADGLIAVSPEYNYGMSGVLKNALDWASRPAMKSPLKGKPSLIMTASPGFTGGVRAQYQVRETLSGCLARVIARPQVVIPAVHEKIADGRLTDAASIDFALAAVDDLIAEIRIVRLSQAA
jgi:chromate reductase